MVMVMVMNDLLPPPLCNVNRPSHSGMRLFQNWPWKSMVKVMCVVKGQGHVWTSKFKGQGYGEGQTHCSHLRPGVQSKCLLFVSWQSDHFWLRYRKFHIWPWKFKAAAAAPAAAYELVQKHKVTPGIPGWLNYWSGPILLVNTFLILQGKVHDLSAPVSSKMITPLYYRL